MVPKDHGFGKSFKGVGEYLMHDKDHANTNERVAGSHVHNMGTQDAETAFRVMASVALDQTRLKEQAHERAQAELPEEERKAFRNSGRKSSDHVWHYSLSWAPEEAETLTKEQMIDAAKSSLAVLGKDQSKNHNRRQFADEHQAVFVCHQDGEHPHVHVVVNRVHQEHGNMLSKYNDWQRFSRWAQDYEEQRGQVFCKQRVANNMTRDQRNLDRKNDQFKVYGQGDLPHHLTNASSTERIAANDNESLVQKMAQREREKAAALAKKGREQAEAQRQQRKALLKQYQERKAALFLELENTKRTERAKVFARFQHEQTMIIERQQTAALKFEHREHDLVGKARNIIDAVKAQWAVQNFEDRKFKLSDYYKPITGEGARLDAFRAEQHMRQRQFEIERDRALQRAVSPALLAAETQRLDARAAYAQEQARLKAEHARQDAELKAQWQQRNQAREKALAAVQALPQRVRATQAPRYTEKFNIEAQEAPIEAQQGQGDESREQEREQRAQAARDFIAQHREAARDKDQGRDQAEDQGQDQGDDGMSF